MHIKSNNILSESAIKGCSSAVTWCKGLIVGRITSRPIIMQEVAVVTAMQNTYFRLRIITNMF